MNIEQAFNNVQKVVRLYRGTYEEHATLEASLIKIKELINEQAKERTEKADTGE